MKRLALFPVSTTIKKDELSIAGVSITSLAEEYGTPLYVYDSLTLNREATGYRSALASAYPQPAFLTYAGKAFLCKAIAQWTQLHHLQLDCSSDGELAIAHAAGVPREDILMHGVNKSRTDLESAMRHAGTIVVDHLLELEQIHSLQLEHPGKMSIWLRFVPGITVTTHHVHTQTGQPDSKFGMSHEELLQAAEYCRKNNLPLVGIHFHLGSNFQVTAPLREAVKLGIEMAHDLGFEGEWHFCPGGGWGVAYHEDDLPQPDVREYVQAIAAEVIENCARQGLPLPILHLEPGRSLIARAGVAVYRVGAIKPRAGKTWVLVDGGMTDNPRHALYGARYTCLPVSQPDWVCDRSVSIGGPHCESGDVLIDDLPMPHLQVGDLLAIPVSGAYQLSMSSNYNGARRPAVLWLEDGRASLIQRRESLEDLLRRDDGLPQVTPAPGADGSCLPGSSKALGLDDVDYGMLG